METGETNGVFGFVLWLVWIAIVTLVLGGVAYLFVGGSSFFSSVNSTPVVLYRQLDTDSAMVSVRGSIVLPSACDRLELDTKGDTKEVALNFTLRGAEDCIPDVEGQVPETFFTEFNGDNYTRLRVIVDGVEQEVIIK